MPRPAPELLHLVECLGRLLAGSLRERGGEVGLQLVHLQALAYLRDANRYSNTPRALAEFLGLTKGTVSQSLLLLHRRGLVEREADAADGRVVRLRLSARGLRLLDRAEILPDWEQALAAVPAGERAAARKALRGLLAGLQWRRGNLSFGECRSCAHVRREGAGAYRCGLTGEPLQRFETLQICREHRWAGETGQG